jgi:NADH dehydrogenase (ubiquinone) Fe-S protein 3
MIYLNSFAHLNKYIDHVVIEKNSILENDIQLQIHNDLNLFFFHISNKSSLYSFNQLVDIICLDLLRKDFRFCVIYNMLSIRYTNRFFLKSYCTGFKHIESVSLFFRGSNWLEREVFDMFGVYFVNNGDLRRLLCDYGFRGFPLRKDFPLVGIFEKYYSIAQNRICVAEVSLCQEMRFLSKKE